MVRAVQAVKNPSRRSNCERYSKSDWFVPGEVAMNRRCYFLSTFVGLFLLPISMGWSAEAFRVGFPSLATGFAPSWVAADKAIWKKHGLDVELIFLRGGSRTVSALIGGSVDFIIGSDLGVTTALLQGASLIRVGVTTNTLGYSMVTQPNIKTIRNLTKIDVANVGGGLNTSTAILQKSRSQVLRFLRGYMEAIQYLKSHKDESLKIFSKYVRNPDLAIMAYLYEEISSRVETGLRPQAEAVRALLDLAAQDFPQAKRLTEKDNWDLSLIDEIQKSGFLDQLQR